MEDEDINIPLTYDEGIYSGEYSESGIDSDDYYDFGFNDSSESDEDTSGVDNSELVERLDSFISSVNSSMNMMQYYNQALGFYVFPDYDTLVEYFPQEDNDSSEWVQASNCFFVQSVHLDEYELYLASLNEDVETTESGMTDLELLEDIDNVLHEQQSSLDIFISTVSGNDIPSVTVTPDEWTSEIIYAIRDNQVELFEYLSIINNSVLIIFLVVVFDLLSRTAKRIIKNMMKGGNDNE